MKLTYGAGAALVTGGTGGIGSEVVRTLAACSIPTAFTWRSREDEARQVAASAAGSAPVKAFRWASSDAAAARGIAERTAEELGPLRYFVSCSGIAGTRAFHAFDEEAWKHMLDANLTSTIAIARAAVTPMMKAGSGRIVLTGSVSGLRGMKGHSVYAATKAALSGFARALAQECAGFGVTVNCVAPGWVDTPMLPAELKAEVLRTIPAGRIGAPADVAALIAFLLSEQAAYITGQTLVVDGGLSA